MELQSSSIETPRPVSPRKRSASGRDPSPPQRGKRGRYSSAACVECKRRKLKCNRTGRADCERCIVDGIPCIFVPNATRRAKDNYDDHSLQDLKEEMSQLRSQVEGLTGIVMDLKDEFHESQSRLCHPREAVATQSPTSTHRDDVPKQPQFVGPTRSAFGIMIGERSLNLMGVPAFESLPLSGFQSPNASIRTATESDFWDRCSANEVTKLLVIFQEEIQPVYPLIEISNYYLRSQEIIDAVRNGSPSGNDISKGHSLAFDSNEIEIAKVAVAIGVAIEMHGANDLSAAIIDSVERDVSRLLRPKVDLKEVQLLAMLSIYYFHCGEELLAWRTIGLAARESLEMGLHRKQSLFDNFKDPDLRRLAVRVFWCVYILDRRWSFGTSLSFALVDKDIDSELPEPDSEFQFLKCMVGYGRLSSKLWDAIPIFGSSSQSIPDHTAVALDTCTKDWLESIPPYLQLRHPRSGPKPGCQPRSLQQLRALLHLRGNYIRILIYRQYVMSPDSISANPKRSRLAVDIAQDTIRVLVHLHGTSDIYSRQENVFNYFLFSAIAMIFLAVCHAPATFAVPCRANFLEGVELVRGLSERRNMASCRLWQIIRGLIPRMRSLSLRHVKREQLDSQTATANKVSEDSAGVAMYTDVTNSVNTNGRAFGSAFESSDFPRDEMMSSDLDTSASISNMIQVREDLLNLFDGFGQGRHMPQLTRQYGESGEFDEMSRAFQYLI